MVERALSMREVPRCTYVRLRALETRLRTVAWNNPLTEAHVTHTAILGDSIKFLFLFLVVGA